MTTSIEWTVDLEAVFDAGLIVISAVPWCCVDDARPCVECDVVSEHCKRVAPVERMLEHEALEDASFKRGERWPSARPVF